MQRWLPKQHKTDRYHHHRYKIFTFRATMVTTIRQEPWLALKRQRQYTVSIQSLYKRKSPFHITGKVISCKWWEQRESNPRPSACKADALNQLSYAPVSFLFADNCVRLRIFSRTLPQGNSLLQSLSSLFSTKINFNLLATYLVL